MKISPKAKYGVTALYELAQHFGAGPVSLNTIAVSQDISEPYLEQLMGKLRRAGFVKSVRGAQGGYMLAKPPCDISIGSIITALEGPIAFVDCLNPSEDMVCGKAERCGTRSVWTKVTDGINDVLDSIKLADLCGESGCANCRVMATEK